MESTPELQTTQIVSAILEYFQEVRSTLGDEAKEQMDVACECLSDVFKVNQGEKYSLKPQSLPQIISVGLQAKDKISKAVESLHKKSANTAQLSDFESQFVQYLNTITEKGFFANTSPNTPEYEQRFALARSKFCQKVGKKAASTPVPAPVSAPTPMVVETPKEEQKPVVIDVEQAEKFKNDGNTKLNAKQYPEAIECYSKAIELNPNNHIYYANRAAALSHQAKHKEAIEDCNAAIKISPNYAKAFGRLGLAHFSLGQYKEAAEAYEKGIVLEPNNDNFKTSLDIAKKKIAESQPKPSAAPQMPNLANMFGNNPNLANLMGQLGGGGGSGGMPDFGQILQNPAFQSFANQMMQNPTFMNMAQNLMANPDAAANMMNMANQMGVDPSAMPNLPNLNTPTTESAPSSTSNTNPSSSSGDDCDTLN